MSEQSTYTTLNRATFKLSGPDAKRYLNGQITQNVEQASETQALATCITNAKGKLEGVAFIRMQDDSILLDSPIQLRESLFLRLDKYIIADDVTLEDVTDQYQWQHLLGNPDKKNSWKCNRFGIEGYDILEQTEGKALTQAELQHLRIQHKIPLWGAELSDNILPPEALLEASAISYNKGCYIGQEVISRIRSAGKVNQRLTFFKLNQSITTPFTIPNPEDADGKPAGVITSCSTAESSTIALGYLKKKWFNHSAMSVGELDIVIEHPPFF